MDLIAPAGPVYQAGTFSGNPLAMAAGVEILQILDNPAVWENLNARSNQLKEGVISILRRKALNYQLQSVGSMFTLFFAENPVTNWTTASLANREKYAQFFRNMLDYGVYLAPSQFEAGFLSSMHGEHEILFTLEAIEKSLV